MGNGVIEMMTFANSFHDPEVITCTYTCTVDLSFAVSNMSDIYTVDLSCTV